MEKSILTGHEQRRIIGLGDEVLFRELLDFASEVCLGKKIEIEASEAPVDEKDPERELIRILGVRGLQNAFDIIDNKIDIDTSSLPDGERDCADGTGYILHDSLLRNHYYDCKGTDPIISELAEQLGRELLDESFKVLGSDVYSQIEKLKHAPTQETQVGVITWLIRRIEDIKYHKNSSDITFDGENEDGYMYHPVRLSPNAMGIFPNHTLRPTCLGFSVIVASFFEKAGLEHMHAGMMESAYQLTLRQAYELFDSDYLKRYWQDEVPEPLLETIRRGRDNLRNRLTKETGYHAMNYVRLKGGWVQVDANLNQNCFVDKLATDKLDEAFDQLREFSSLAPGMHRTLYMPSMANLPPWMIELVLEQESKVKNIEEIIDEATLEQILRYEDESIPQRIKERSVDIFIERRSDIIRLARDLYGTLDNDMERRVLSEDSFYRCFEKYVLWGMDIDEWRQRCLNDKAFLTERCKDLNGLPQMMSLIQVYAHHNTRSNQQHGTVEVGLPAHRVGMAVLSDFASYFDDSLSSSFWLSEWPSQVAQSAWLYRKESHEVHENLKFFHAAWVQAAGLHYWNSYDMINSYLSEIDRDGGEENGKS